MKVVHVCTMVQSGGAARSTVNLHLTLRHLGVESSILTLEDASDKIPYCVRYPSLEERSSAVKDITHLTVLKDRPSTSNTYFSMDLFGCDISHHPLVQQADVINLSWVAKFLSSVSLAKLATLGKPLLWTLHDMRPLTGGCHFSEGCHRFEETCGKCPQLNEDIVTEPNLQAMRLALAVAKPIFIAPSQWMLENVRKSIVSKDLEGYCIPNGVNPDIFKPLEKKSCRSELSLKKDVWYILFAAHWLKELRKGAAHALRILEEAGKNRQIAEAVATEKIRVLCCGTEGGDFRPIGWKVETIPYISPEKMPLFYNSGNILLFTSLEDNLPNIILEAMACGIPTISHRVGGTPDLLENPSTGCLFEIGDTEGAVAAIVDLFQNKQLYQEMSARSIEKAKWDFSLEKQAASYLQLYEKALARPRSKAVSFSSHIQQGSIEALFPTIDEWKSKREFIQLNEQMSQMFAQMQELQNNLFKM